MKLLETYLKTIFLNLFEVKPTPDAEFTIPFTVRSRNGLLDHSVPLHKRQKGFAKISQISLIISPFQGVKLCSNLDRTMRLAYHTP